jgi:hypothetical protein
MTFGAYRPRAATIEPGAHALVEELVDEREPRGLRLARQGVLLLLVALMVARAPYAARTMDFSRDVFIAQRILHGEAFPLIGPIFADSFHLGPIWDYVLALILASSGGSWNGTVCILGILIATQIPLAYLAGKALDGRRTGLLWACVLALPSWDTFESVFPSHPSLATPLLLAFVLCAIRQWRKPATRHLLGMALSFVLALHAHPSSISLTWLAIPVVAQSGRHGNLRVRDVALAILIVAIPVLPFLILDATHGFMDVNAIGHYTTTINPYRALIDAWPVLRAVTADGTLYWLGTMIGSHGSVMHVICIGLALGGTLAIGGAARSLLDSRARPLMLLALAMVAAVTLFTTAIRDITPFYMTSPLHVVACGAIALALAGLGRATWAVGLRGGLIVFALVIAATANVGIARFQTRGALPFAWFPLMDVKHPAEPTVPVLMTPAYAMAASGRFLCDQRAASIHGGYANQLLLNYSIEMRLACGRDDVRIGGSDPARDHWLGLSRAMFAELDVDPARRIGSMGLVPARPVDAGRELAVAHEPRYPAYPSMSGPDRERHLSIDLAFGEYAVVSDNAFIMDTGFTARATVDGRALPPRASDGVSRVFDCGCIAADGRAVIDLIVRSANLPDIDVVVFARPGPQ